MKQELDPGLEGIHMNGCASRWGLISGLIPMGLPNEHILGDPIFHPQIANGREPDYTVNLGGSKTILARRTNRLIGHHPLILVNIPLVHLRTLARAPGGLGHDLVIIILLILSVITIIVIFSTPGDRIHKAYTLDHIRNVSRDTS